MAPLLVCAMYHCRKHHCPTTPRCEAWWWELTSRGGNFQGSRFLSVPYRYSLDRSIIDKIHNNTLVHKTCQTWDLSNLGPASMSQPLSLIETLILTLVLTPTLVMIVSFVVTLTPTLNLVLSLTIALIIALAVAPKGYGRISTTPSTAPAHHTTHRRR